MHPTFNQMLVQDRHATLHAEADAARLASTARSRSVVDDATTGDTSTLASASCDESSTAWSRPERRADGDGESDQSGAYA